MFKEIKAVLFDLDGTLVDSAPDLGFAANCMRSARGLAGLPLEHYRWLAGSGARGMLEIAFQVTPLDAEYEALREEFYGHYEACLTERTVAFEGVAQLLDGLARRSIPWGVVTNKSSRFTSPMMLAMPLFRKASTVVCGDTTAHTKPHPAPLLEAARRLALDPAHCMYVGDDQRDVTAGRAAGMATVAATYGYLGKGGDASGWGAQACIATPLDLLGLLPGA